MGTQDNIFELFRTLKAGLGGDRCVQILPLQRGQRTDFTAGDLRILRLDGGLYVGGHQTVAGQLQRIEPDAHCILGAENGGFSYAFNPAQRLLQGTDEKVANIEAG